jgi:DNA repair photolyase
VPRVLRRDRREFQNKVAIRKNIIENLKHDIERVRITEPVLLCFTCDPYTPEVENDPYNQTTSRAIILLAENKINFQILTKAGRRAVKDFGLYKKGDKFAVTLTFLDPMKSLVIEPFAALPDERLEALALAKKKGIETWVSIEPALNEVEVHKLITASAPYTDFYKVGKVTDYQSDITDWPGFIAGVRKHLDSLGKPYMLKKDLKKCLVDSES